MADTVVVFPRERSRSDNRLPRAGPLIAQKSRAIEAQLSDRPSLESSYQRSFCHPSCQSRLPPLSPFSERPEDGVRSRSLDFDDPLAPARQKIWTTTYEDAYCSPFPQSVLSLSGPVRAQPEPPAVATAVTTQSAVKSRSIAPESPLAQTRGMTLSRGDFAKATPDPRWQQRDAYAPYK
jgi:hypothetical protein